MGTLARWRERLSAEDEQFRNARPDETVAEAARRPGLRIAQVMATVIQGYADRSALGQRVKLSLTPQPGVRRCATCPDSGHGRIHEQFGLLLRRSLLVLD